MREDKQLNERKAEGRDGYKILLCALAANRIDFDRQQPAVFVQADYSCLQGSHAFSGQSPPITITISPSISPHCVPFVR